MDPNDPFLASGDFNARCGTLKDYTIDSYSGNNGPLDALLPPNLNTCGKVYDFLKKKSIIERNISDTSLNHNGSQLIDLCKMSNLFIINGRKGNSDFSFIDTRGRKSMIDYLLATVTSYPLIKEFRLGKNYLNLIICL